MVPLLVSAPKFVCVKYFDEPIESLFFSPKQELDTSDITAFLDRIQPIWEKDNKFPINEFIKVENIQKRGFAVLPHKYNDRKIGHNCHRVANLNEMKLPW